MKKPDIIKEPVEPYGEVRVDSKNRVTLKPLGSARISSYKVYRNSLGQYILDPQVSVPAHEAWIYQDERILNKIKRGLNDIKAGRVHDAKEDYTKYIDDEG